MTKKQENFYYPEFTDIGEIEFKPSEENKIIETAYNEEWIEYTKPYKLIFNKENKNNE